VFIVGLLGEAASPDCRAAFRRQYRPRLAAPHLGMLPNVGAELSAGLTYILAMIRLYAVMQVA